MAKIGIDTVLLAGAVKPLMAKALSGFVGDGTLMSGLVKIGAGKFIGKKAPAWLRMALLVDGAEDIAVSLMSGAGGFNLGAVFSGGSQQVNVL